MGAITEFDVLTNVLVNFKSEKFFLLKKCISIKETKNAYIIKHIEDIKILNKVYKKSCVANWEIFKGNPKDLYKDENPELAHGFIDYHGSGIHQSKPKYFSKR